MNNKILLRAGNIIAELLCAAAVTFSVVPAFLLTGNLLFQTAATLIIVLLFVLIADRLGVKAVTFAHSLAVMSSFWTFFALFKQIQYKASVGDKSIWFYHFFYYDKPAMLYVAFCVIILFYIIKLLFKNNDEAYVSDYKKFMRITLICFFIYYILTLIYSFFLCRRPAADRSPVNFIPFQVIAVTFFTGRIDYERIILFLGNFVIFLPLGTVMPVLLKKNKGFILALFPILLSVGIEVGQYVFAIGEPDIDDVILNVSGFYFGILLKMIFDKIVFKVSKGKLQTVFLL